MALMSEYDLGSRNSEGENLLTKQNLSTITISYMTKTVLRKVPHIFSKPHIEKAHNGTWAVVAGEYDQYGTPSYDTYLPMENGTAAEILRENGYATFCVGKYNGAPHENGTLAGPYNRWATGRGFDHFYGLCAPAGADDQWHPKLYRDTHREPDDSLGQPAITRFASEAINYIADQQSAAPEQPFFLYFAPGTAHTPFHASKEWVDKYHGRFDGGWEDYARRTLENQLREGIVPAGQYPCRWKSLPASFRRPTMRSGASSNSSAAPESLTIR